MISRNSIVTILITAFFLFSPFVETSLGFSKEQTKNDLSLSELIRKTLSVGTPTRSKEEYSQAAEAYKKIIEELKSIETDDLNLDNQIDFELLESHLKVKVFEIVTLRLYELSPASYFSLGITDSLFVRPCSRTDRVVRQAIAELGRLPGILANGRKNLTNPARVWTENAIYQAYYAKLLLKEYIPETCVDDPDLEVELLDAAQVAFQAVEEYAQWLENDLLPRSTRPPSWKVEEIEFYLFEKEQLREYGVADMLRIAEKEESACMDEMEQLARRIHPSGDLRRAWDLMKEEAPPWPEVLPMAAKYVDRVSEWLRGPGSHIIDIPENLDYGVQITSPLIRRSLSFGGSCQGHITAGRTSGYYVLTPLEDRLTPDEKMGRIKAYNPYWTRVISYHEWLGHVVHFGIDDNSVERPMRKAAQANLSQPWAFYLEKLLEDEGYFKTLSHMGELKTRMARLQMRMWRIQRILTKLKMARGEMTFEESVDAYVDKVGMDRTNAFIEVQRDCQSPRPPGSEIIGEMVLLELREEYQRRLGKHYCLKNFHRSLLRHGSLPFPLLRRLIFRGEIGRNEGR